MSRKTPPPYDLPREMKRRIQFWTRDKGYPRRFTTKQYLDDQFESCLDWHRANGVSRVDWEATARNWIRNDLKWRGIGPSAEEKRKSQEPPSSPLNRRGIDPHERRHRPPQHVGAVVLELFGEEGKG